LEIKAVRGMHDLLGDEAAKWQYVEARIRSILETFGYSEIRTPVLESAEVFTQAVGDNTDIVEKQMYTVQDRSHPESGKSETLVLRPEATSSVVRAVLEHQLHRAPHPQRLYYVLPMFRYERPQKGRLRQFHQIGAELIQDPSPEADAEMIVLLDTIFRTFGLKDFEIRINSVGSEACRPQYKEALKAYLHPHLEALCEQCKKRYERAPMRILDCKVESCKVIAEKAPRMVDHLDAESKAHFEGVKSRLREARVAFVEDTSIVRGLDYYSRTAFEFTSSLLGAQSALGGGGRYDELASRFGAPAFPAVGWALGFERLIMALQAKDLLSGGVKKPDFYFAPLGEKAFEALYALSIQMKRQGVSVEFSYERDKKLKWLMKQADRSGARFTLLLGEDELAAGSAALKNMSTGEQEKLSLADIEAELKRRACHEA
jgi:histidyl-tRNA synthetase